MNDEQLLRYSRHILLDPLGIEGQRRLLQSRVVVVGAGGLGSPVALYLGAAGVGHLTLVDDDVVDLTNLQRQIAHATASVGYTKVASAAAAVKALNPDVVVEALQARVDGTNAASVISRADVVVDCTDNFTIRQVLNAACVRSGKPLVSGAALGFDGQVSLYHPAGMANGPCYACIFPPDAQPDEARCATMGVFAPLVGIIGTTMAGEVLKVLTGLGRSLSGRLQLLDARSSTWEEIGIARQPDCPICGELNVDPVRAEVTDSAS